MKFDRVGFIGGGKMAQALAHGIVGNKIYRADQIMVSDPDSATTDSFCKQSPGAQVAKDNLHLADKCDLIFIAVKPQLTVEALQGIDKAVSANQLWVSVVAGIQIARLSQLLGTKRIIRVMPNTPCLIGEGASGIAVGPNAFPEDLVNVKQICDGIGKSVEVREALLDAVTGLSGSGPAYVFTFIESLVDGGVLMGLPNETAKELAIQTIIGAAKLVLETGKSPSELRSMVSSPGGTTIAGLKALEDGAFRSTVMNAVQAACDKSKRLGELNIEKQS